MEKRPKGKRCSFPFGPMKRAGSLEEIDEQKRKEHVLKTRHRTKPSLTEGGDRIASFSRRGRPGPRNDRGQRRGPATPTIPGGEKQNEHRRKKRSRSGKRN